MRHLFKNQPPGLFVLSFLELWDRFNYYGIQSSLIIYLISRCHYSDATAYTVFGIFSALAFTTPTLGGMLADKFLGYKNSVVLGIIVSMCGVLMLILSQVSLHSISPAKLLLYAGLAMLVCGVGLFKASNMTLVGMLYNKTDALKDNGFSICYSAMNLGAILGPITYGFIILKYGFTPALIISVSCSLLSLISIQIFAKTIDKRLYTDKHKTKLKHKLWFIAGLVIAIGAICWLFAFPKVFNYLIFIVIIMVFILVQAIKKQQPNFSAKITALMTLIFFAMFYFTLQMQMGSSLTLYISRFVNTHIGAFYIPATATFALEPIFFIVLTPVLALAWPYLDKIQKHNATTDRVILGLLCGAASFLIYGLSAYVPDQGLINYRLLGIILGYVLLGAGDVCISPMITSAVTYLTPANRQGIFMGFWFLSNGLAAYFASILAKVSIVSTNNMSTAADFSHGFFIMGVITVIAAVALILLHPLIRKWEID